MNYYIITFSKVHHKITEEFRKEILTSDASSFELEDGSIVKVNGISDILPETKYFQEYPDKRPDDTRNQFQDNYGKYGNQQVRKPSKRAKELMTQGFIDVRINKFGETRAVAVQKFENFIAGKNSNFNLLTNS